MSVDIEERIQELEKRIEECVEAIDVNTLSINHIMLWLQQLADHVGLTLKGAKS